LNSRVKLVKALPVVSVDTSSSAYLT